MNVLNGVCGAGGAGRGEKERLTEFGEMLPGCRPMHAKVLASSAEFTPQFGATFAWHRMWTFILQTDRGNIRDGK